MFQVLPPEPPPVAAAPEIIIERSAATTETVTCPAQQQGIGQGEFLAAPAWLELQPPQGKAMGKPGWLRARVWVTDTMLIEAVAAGTVESLPAERAQEFLRSVVIKP